MCHSLHVLFKMALLSEARASTASCCPSIAPSLTPADAIFFFDGDVILPAAPVPAKL